MPFICDAKTEQYIKALAKFREKMGKYSFNEPDPYFDQITRDENLALYDLYCEKLASWPYNKRPANPIETLQKGRDTFIGLSGRDQVTCLTNIHGLFGRLAGGCDLTLLGGVAKAGVTTLGSSLSNWAKAGYQDVRIVDQSASGLFETKSANLLDLL